MSAEASLLRDLDSDVEQLLERHLKWTKEWFPHEYVPYERGREHINNIRILKRVETPDDLIGLAMFLSSPASSFITGQSIACCGGEVML